MHPEQAGRLAHPSLCGSEAAPQGTKLCFCVLGRRPSGGSARAPMFMPRVQSLSHKGSPKILEWVAYPFPRGSSRPGIRPGFPALQTDSLPTELSLPRVQFLVLGVLGLSCFVLPSSGLRRDHLPVSAVSFIALCVCVRVCVRHTYLCPS